MPYISKDRRGHTVDHETTAGDLNYMISMLLIKYWKFSQRDYQSINDIVGAIEGAKSEFQRRIVIPYENLKITQNGDIYD